jgi:hypothetical protein
MLNKIHAYQETQLIYVAAKLKISDHLKEGGKTPEELAVLTGTHKGSLYRVLRACSALGLYEEKNKKFYLTEYGKLLISDNPDTLRPVAIMRGEEVNWKPWEKLLFAVETGRSAFMDIFKMNLFEYYKRNPEAGNSFNEGMRIFTRFDIDMILNNYDFSCFKKIVDAGGGNGALLMSILEKYGECCGVLFDLPEVIEEAKEYVYNSRMKDRIAVEAGNIFLRMPEGGDCYILKKILHDWDDGHSIGILKNCRKSIAAQGKLLIMDYVIKENSPAGKVNDIHMMLVCPGGMERTEEEFVKLLDESGFKLTKIILDKGVSIIECTPV